MEKAAIQNKFTSYRNRVVEIWQSSNSSNTVFRNMAMLASGSGAAKVIGMLSAPMITRIYLPEHLGVLSVFTALAAMIMPFSTLRYNMAIPLPKSDGLATNLAVISALFLFITSSLSFFVFWLASPALLRVVSMEQLLPFWWLLPLSIAGSGTYELLTNWGVREKAFKPLAKTQVWQAAIGAIVKISFGFFGFKPLGLLIGHVFTETGGVLSLSRSFQQKFKNNYRHISKKRMVFLLKRYAEFPKFRLSSQILMLMATKLPLLFFAWNFGAKTAGQFGLAMMILLLPLTLFGQTTSQAYYAEIAKISRKNPRKIYSLTKSVTKRLFAFSVIPFLGLLIFGPWLFVFVFGEIWREAGVFASILAINLLTMFIANPITSALNVLGKQLYYLQINLIRLIMVCVVFYIVYLLGMSSYFALFLYSISISFHRIFVYYRILQMIKSCENY